jgi:integrase
MVHKNSLALAEEWLKSLEHGSLKNRGKPLAPRTIDRYRDAVVGRGWQKKGHPTPPLLVWWADVAPGRSIWSVTRDELLEWFYSDVYVRDGVTKPPSSSETNNRRAAALNLLTWAGTPAPAGRGLKVAYEVMMYQPPVEDRAHVRRKMVKLDPLDDGAFGPIWHTVSEPDDWLWIGMAAFMTMRIDEIANLRPEDVDLERRFAEFIGKGQKRRIVHYGELLDDWSYLDHLGVDAFIPNEWAKRFEDHVFKRQADAEAMPPGPLDSPWWVWPYTEGQSRPHRDNKRQLVWSPSDNDRNRFAKRWQRRLVAAGFTRHQYRPHQLRHFASVNMWRAGVPWQRIVAEMGHDEGATTFTYSDFRPDYNRERARNERKRGADTQ